MARCIVKSCTNNKAQFHPEHKSFLKLPEDEIVREGWFRKIGEVKLPPKIENARICSVHFTDDCFIYGKNRKESARNRRLRPNAIPTLNLGTTQRRSDEVFHVNVVKKQFPLFIGNSGITQGSGHTGNEVTAMETCTEPSPSSVSNNCANCGELAAIGAMPESSKSLLQTNPWSNCENRVCRTPPSSSNVLDDCRGYYTFPRRSHNSKAVPESKCMQDLKRVSKSQKRKIAQDNNARECISDENSPPWKRRQRFIEEWIGNDAHGEEISRKHSDPYVHIEWFKDEVKYLRSLLTFHAESKHTATVTRETAVEDNLKAELERKNEAIRQLLAENQQLHQVLQTLQAKLSATEADKLKAELANNDKVIAILKPYFTDEQIQCILQKRQWVCWSIEDYAAAISLRSVSPKAYRYLKEKLNYPLPSLSSLRRWALAKFDISEGFLEDVLALMKEKGCMLSTTDRVAVMTFDEMILSPDVGFDSKLEKLVKGRKVQVIMVRGLFGAWKQPVYYNFDQPMTKDIFMLAVEKLYKAGYEVVAATSDMGNQGLWGKLGITTDNHCIDHPHIQGGQIFIFADVPHLLKLVRNWFIDDGFMLPMCTERFTASVFQSLVTLSASSDLRVAHKITQRLLDAQKLMRQAVKPAAQLFSHTSGKAISWAGENNLLNISKAHCSAYSDFVLIVNSWFDVHNSYVQYGNHPGVNGFGVDLERQTNILQLMSMYMHESRVGKRKSLMPFQKGVIISNSSLRQLHKYLQAKYPDCNYILTRRLQQDILENFFAYIRAMGSSKDHPSAYEFRYRLRWYILGKHSHAVFSMNTNTQEDLETSCMSSSVDIDEFRTPTPPTATSTRKNLRASTPISGVAFKDPDSSSSSRNLQDDFFQMPEENDDIILTEELFRQIIDVAPEELGQNISKDVTDETNEKENDNHLIQTDKELHLFIKQLFDNSSVTPGRCTASDIVQEGSLQYVAGYVAHRFRTKYPFLGQRTCKMENDENEKNRVKVVSKGYLTYPSDDLLTLSKIMEDCFVHFHGEYFSTKDGVIRKVVAIVKDKAKPLTIPEDVLQCLVKTRTYIRVKEINRRAYAVNDDRRKEKKMKKIVCTKY